MSKKKSLEEILRHIFHMGDCIFKDESSDDSSNDTDEKAYIVIGVNEFLDYAEECGIEL